MSRAYQDLVDRLKREATERCEGCRISWRLDGWRHREPMPIECRAKAQRQKLRELSQAARMGELA